MDTYLNSRSWKVLCWNVRGINSDKKWDSIRDKIVESNCDILCLQETKRENFDIQFIKKFCSSSFDSFEFLPSVGASGGILTVWKSYLFHGQLVFSNDFNLTVEFSSKHNDSKWVLSNIYAPCTAPGRHAFLHWFKNIQMPAEVYWLIVGDFNLIRKPENRNKPGGDLTNMFLFNEALSALGLVKLPLYGKQFTWTNKQASPLLERLDWFFTSQSWSNNYPSSSVSTMAMKTSDHVPCLISINTSIPKGKVFRFENYLMEHEHFIDIVQHGWSLTTSQTDTAKIITAKFKNLRRVIEAWQSQLSSLKAVISNVKLILTFLGFLEEFRDLALHEWNFRVILEQKLISLLRQQKIYWKQRGTIRWVTKGDAGKNSFMQMPP